MSEKPASLAAALAAFQANLPSVAKSETAIIPTKSGGSFKYSYADLAEVSSVVLPLLGALGLSFITKPTVVDGKFVLAYKLLHECGDAEEGLYPLSGGTAQEIGSAITYGRRYALCAVVGVAPDRDDDGAAASARRTEEPTRESWDDAQPRRSIEPTVAQQQMHASLAARIRACGNEEDLLAAFNAVVEAYKADQLTEIQANDLRAQVKDRRQQLPPAAEPTEPAALTAPTRKRIFALYRAIGMEDDADQHQFADATLKRDNVSFKTLTEAEGLKLAAALDGRKRAMGVKA